MSPHFPPCLRYETRERRCSIALNRPDSLNALNRELMGALDAAVAEFERDEALLVAILSGEGGRAFSTGGDLKEIASSAAATPASERRGFPPPRLGEMPGFDAVNRCRKPIIAAIDGYCIAGGFELALYCDIRLATRQSSFGLPEPRRSMLAGPGLHNLSRMIPLGEALRLQLTGGRIGAERAHAIGLVQELADDRAELFAKADALADEILACAPLAVQAIKRIVKQGRNLPVEYSWLLAEPWQEGISRSEDALEGPRAFAEKRAPDWKLR